jgi:hypothetical protein
MTCDKVVAPSEYLTEFNLPWSGVTWKGAFIVPSRLFSQQEGCVF